MRKKAGRGAGRAVVAACAAALLAGCAAPPREAHDGAIVVLKIDRAAWNAPLEERLFRLDFDAKAALWIRRQAGVLQAPESQDAYFSQIEVLEDEAGRELRSRALCGGSAQFVSYLDGASGQGGITAIFRCRLQLF
ncbi:MAG: hypothetical protein IPP91_12780 [Betaproteobacteria bacterium]|nr:hypothetical protein [Betaproteobacteria bacterium]